MNNGNCNGVSGNPVDKFEEAFMSCLTALTKEDTLTNVDRDEIRVDVEQGIMNVIDSARAMEGYFLKKRLEIAAQKPELLVKDDTTELRLEVVRKDELLKKNYEKISYWQSILADLQSVTSVGGKPVGTGQGVPAGTPAPNQASSQQGPLTPAGRPQTPGSVGRPQTPVTSAVGSPAGRIQSKPAKGKRCPTKKYPPPEETETATAIHIVRDAPEKVPQKGCKRKSKQEAQPLWENTIGQHKVTPEPPQLIPPKVKRKYNRKKVLTSQPVPQFSNFEHNSITPPIVPVPPVAFSSPLNVTTMMNVPVNKINSNQMN